MLSKRNKSGFRGVCRINHQKGFYAQISINGLVIGLGYHPTAEAAAAIYDQACDFYKVPDRKNKK